MSYDIYMKDPVTRETIELAEPHMMRGGTYAVGGTRELWLNITYNYSGYYYDFDTENGIRGIYGMTGAESIPVLEGMIQNIKAKYQKEDGSWIDTVRHRVKYYDIKTGDELDIPDLFHKNEDEVREEEFDEMLNEGPNDNYWEATAANALRPLYQLISMARMRPDGIWDGD